MNGFQSDFRTELIKRTRRVVPGIALTVLRRSIGNHTPSRVTAFFLCLALITIGLTTLHAGSFNLAGAAASPFIAKANLLTFADGSGTISVAPLTAQAGTTQSFIFTYTADPDGLINGEIDIAIPAGWSGGSATSSTGSAVITSGVIKVTGITLASGSMTIGLNNVTVPGTTGANTFNTQEKSTSGGTLTSLAVQPVVNVTANGTLTSFATHNDFAVGSRPTSVATGDFNGDGKLDLAVTNFFSASVSVLLGTGTGSVGAKTDFATGNNPQSVAIGDFNGDGNLDLAVANFSSTVSILLGTGTGSFGAKTDFATGNNAGSVAVGDFNGDGKLDLATANLNGGVSILLGTGTGSFGAKTDFAAGSGPSSVAVGDFNGDGKLDLAVTNSSSATVSIFLGTGTGSFGAKTDFATGAVPKSVAIGDFNADGKLDLAVANFSGDSVSVLLGTGTGTFGAKTDFSTGTFPFSVAVGDFNNDGKLDLAVANNGNSFGNTVSVLPGTGSGSFGARTDLNTGAGPTSVAVGDFNIDGKLDLAVTNQVDDTVGILLNTNTARPLSPLGFSAHNDFVSGGSVESIATGDFNGDGKIDLVTANSNASSVSILLGTGAGTFGAKTDFATGASPLFVAVGDFNGDGKLDLAVANLGGPSVSILLGTGTGAFGAKTDFTTGNNPDSVAVGDFNGDGKLDLAIANASSNTVSILLGTGTGTFGAKTDFGTGSSPVSVAVGDFNGDGRLDLAVANATINTVSILLGTGTGSFGAKTDFATGSSPSGVAVGDFDRNGKLDLAVSNLSGNTVSVLLGTGTGSFGAKTDFGTGSNPKSVRIGDFNGDGKVDLVLPEIGINSVSVLPGTGTDTFGTRIDFATAPTPRSVAIGDFNGDGAPDLATGNGNNISVLLNNSPGPATNLVVTDVNGGINPLSGAPFSVTVRSSDNSGNPANVTADTTISLSLKTGTGILSGTLTGTITAGNQFASISGVIYSKAESGVVITATRTSGDNLLAADSAPFTVNPNGVYTDPAGVCGGNTPCFSNLQTAINSVASGGTVDIGAGTYNQDVNFNASATYNINGNISVNNVTLSAGTVVAGNSTITVTGNWANNGGTFTAGTGTVNVTGSGTIGGSSSTTFNNLTINGSSTTTLGQNETVNGILTLTSDLNTGAFTLTMPDTASSAGTGDVIGTVDRTGFVSGGAALSFGNPFNTIQINSGGAPIDISVKLTETVPTDSSTGQPNSGFPNAVTRTYVITPNGGSGFSTTVQLHYKTGDLNGNAEGSLNLWRFDSGTGKWNNMGSSGHDTTNHAVTQSGITQFSPWTLNSVVPTAADLEKFTATADGNRTFLQWQTGFEVNNLGFNVYRELNGERVRINPSMIAGSALTVGSDVKVEAGYSYNWQDDAVDKTTSYWLEDIDLDGTSTWHGPYGVTSTSPNSRTRLTRTKSVLLSNLGVTRSDNAVKLREYPAGVSTAASNSPAISQTNGRTPTRPGQIPASLQKQWQIASQNAIKIAVNKTGWYKVNLLDLMAAGLSSTIDPDTLQMFVGGVEVPIRVNTRKEVRLTGDDSIEFYGVALDSPTADTQIYWLVAGSGTGKRIAVQQSIAGGSNNAGSFQYTVERKDRSLYFSSLRNGDAENFFGPVIASQPVSQTINVHHVDAGSTSQAEIEIALQGVTAASHQVNVMLNGTAIHAITFNGQDHPITRISIPQSALVEGGNTIKFVAQASGDVSLIDYVKITYAHTYAADSNLIFTTQTGIQPVKITGFTNGDIRAINVATPNQPVEITGTIEQESNGYSISIGAAKRRDLIVFTPEQALSPIAITANQPSTLAKASNGADLVVITYRDFVRSVLPLVALRQSQGYQVSVVDVESIYDQFSYGVHSPQAVKDFLNWTHTHWSKQPQYVLLGGSGTMDPRNYTGLGFMDFVPTKLIDTLSMETASDDWFVDFNNDGQPQMAIGRLPVRSASEMTTVVNKIIAYEQSASPEAVVLVSDLNDGVNFNANNNQIKSIVSSQIATVDIVRGQTNKDARTDLMDQLTQGQRIFNYAGHGSVNLWRGNLLTDDDVQKLANTKTSPLVVTMTCLNGYFQDPHLASLGESLVRVNNGGAVSVWASSGMTDAGNQPALNQAFFRQLFGNQNLTIGQAIKAAKSSTDDNDVRRTWVLFGDPTMRIKQ